MKFLRPLYKLVFLILLQGINGADDTESWSSIGFETKLPYSIELEIDQGLRLKDQMSSFKQTFTQVSIAYEIIDGMKIFVPIRYAIFEDKTKQRISAGGSYRYDLKPLSFKYRSKMAIPMFSFWFWFNDFTNCTNILSLVVSRSINLRGNLKGGCASCLSF